jgi:hypothetical protein
MLQTGLEGGFALGTWPGTKGTAVNANPQGPRSSTAAAYGTTADGPGGMDGHVIGVLSTSTLALILLVYIWWSLPR